MAIDWNLQVKRFGYDNDKQFFLDEYARTPEDRKEGKHTVNELSEMLLVSHVSIRSRLKHHKLFMFKSRNFRQAPWNFDGLSERQILERLCREYTSIKDIWTELRRRYKINFSISTVRNRLIKHHLKPGKTTIQRRTAIKTIPIDIKSALASLIDTWDKRVEYFERTSLPNAESEAMVRCLRRCSNNLKAILRKEVKA